MKRLGKEKSTTLRGNYSSTQVGGLGKTAGNFTQSPTLSVTKALHFHHEIKLSSRLSTTHEDKGAK